MLASPQIKAPDAERPKKSVVCVFDRSGSMSGKKIEQAKVIERFSKEYFEMVGKASASDAKLLSRQQAGQEMMLEVDGDVYHVK